MPRKGVIPPQLKPYIRKKGQAPPAKKSSSKKK